MLLLLLACPPKKTPDSGGDTDAVVDDTAVVDGRWTGDASTEDAVEVLSGDLVDRALQTPEGLYLASPRFDNNTGQVCLDDACWTGAGAGASFGVSMAWVGELAVSAHQDSPNGQWSGAVHLLTSGVVLEGEEGDLAGIAVASVNETLAIGGMGADTTALDGGIVYVLDDGPDDPELIEGTYLFGTDPGGYFGIDVAWAEFDGDGAPDLLVGASGASGEMMGTGAAFAFHGPVEPWSRDLDADFSVRGAVTDDDTGKAVEGIDHDGDGLFEVAVTTRDGWLYMWRTEGEAASSIFEWNGFGHDPHHTGNLETNPIPYAPWLKDRGPDTEEPADGEGAEVPAATGCGQGDAGWLLWPLALLGLAAWGRARRSSPA